MQKRSKVCVMQIKMTCKTQLSRAFSNLYVLKKLALEKDREMTSTGGPGEAARDGQDTEVSCTSS